MAINQMYDKNLLQCDSNECECVYPNWEVSKPETQAPTAAQLAVPLVQL